jgi:hypothetical protein
MVQIAMYTSKTYAPCRELVKHMVEKGTVLPRAIMIVRDIYPVSVFYVAVFFLLYCLKPLCMHQLPFIPVSRCASDLLLFYSKILSIARLNLFAINT